LQDGDVLGGGDASHSLADLYRTTPREIARLNDVAWNKAAIDKWVMATGGKRLPFVESAPYDEKARLGWAVFTSQSKIFLPPGGPRKPVELPASPKLGLSGWGWATIGVIGGGILLSYFGRSE